MREENPAVNPAVNAAVNAADQTRAAILEVICLAGECPMSARYLLPGDTETAKKMVITRLKQSGIISVLGKGDEKRIRLNALARGTANMPKAFAHIRDELGQEYLDHYLTISCDHRLPGNQQKMLRRLRMAEVFAICPRAGIETRPWALPMLCAIPYDGAGMTGTGFYHSRVLKNAYGNAQLVSYTRICGLLISPGGAYTVYNVHKGLIKGMPGGEGKARALIQDVLSNTWKPPADIVRREDRFDARDAIIIGDNITVALNIMADMPKKNSKKLQLNATFDDTYFVLADDKGAFMLWMMTQPQWRTRIVNGLIKKELVSYNRIRDAQTPDGKQLLTWFETNLYVLTLLRTLEPVELQTYIILCFEWQEPLIKKYLGESVTTKTYGHNRIENILNRRCNDN